MFAFSALMPRDLRYAAYELRYYDAADTMMLYAPPLPAD